MGLEALHPPIDFAKILGTQPDKDHRKVESASPVFNIPQGSVQKVLQKEVR
jgi:hypothetical protein